MHNHAPENYKCPICLGVQGIENDDTLIRQTDIVFRDNLATIFIGSFFVGNNPGHPIIVPNQHFENLYDLPVEIGARILELSKNIAVALKDVRRCDGVTIVQNNEPIGGQHAFHYHMHVFPRFIEDDLHANMHHSRKTIPDQRISYAQALKEYYERNF